jgi:S1-C subfamily serine protease
MLKNNQLTPLLALVFLVASNVNAAPNDFSEIATYENIAMGEFKPSSKISESSKVDSDAIKAVIGGGFVGPQSGQILNKVRPDRTVRGAKEAQIYKRYSSSVVLIVTRDGLGTGTLVNARGDILTNFHVVKGAKDVAVIFKPIVDGQKPNKADLIRARVIKIDEVTDLALIHIEKVPPGIEPIVVGNRADIAVGDDVHAIGHPTGESWTYTRGVISQIRDGYEWSTGAKEAAHRANVIQTQTPINPGNSGGPLLTDNGKLAGINSFKSKGEGLNFAIANDEVRLFINSTGDRFAEKSSSGSKKTEAKDGECPLKEIYRGTSKDDTTEIVGYDIDCDGKADFEIRKPYDIRKPIMIYIDENKDGKPDTIIFDNNRDEKWDYSLRDTNFDGKWDLECVHEDGDVEPTRCLPYKQRATK